MQTWQGGAGGRWRREVGVLGFNFKIFKLGGRSSQDQSLLFPNLKFSLYVILRLLSVLEEGVRMTRKYSPLWIKLNSDKRLLFAVEKNKKHHILQKKLPIFQ